MGDTLARARSLFESSLKMWRPDTGSTGRRILSHKIESTSFESDRPLSVYNWHRQILSTFKMHSRRHVNLDARTNKWENTEEQKTRKNSLQIFPSPVIHLYHLESRKIRSSHPTIIWYYARSIYWSAHYPAIQHVTIDLGAGESYQKNKSSTWKLTSR